MEDTAVTTSGRKAAGAALASFAGAAGCGAEALRTHLQLSSLGPICGLDRPALFFLHCPACPAGLAFLAAATVFGGLALRARGPASTRQAPAVALRSRFTIR
jgi:hypothetical protein